MLNHIVVMGRLVRDPEMRSTGSGVQVANFTVAVDRDFSGKEGGEKETDFIDCVAWRKTAEFVQKYFAKGKMAVVSGRLQIRRWNDKDGNQRRSAEIQVDNIYFGESKSQSGGIPGGVAPAMGYENTMDYMQSRYGVSAVPTSEYAALTDDDDQLPF